MMLKKVLSCLVLVIGSNFAGDTFADDTLAADSWRFILLADWHSAEKFVHSDKNTESFKAAVNEDIKTIRWMKETHQREFLLLPGDSNGGHWDTPKFIQSRFPGATPEESILQDGRLCYSGMIDTFRKGGYDKLIMDDASVWTRGLSDREVSALAK